MPTQRQQYSQSQRMKFQRDGSNIIIYDNTNDTLLNINEFNQAVTNKDNPYFLNIFYLLANFIIILLLRLKTKENEKALKLHKEGKAKQRQGV